MSASLEGEVKMKLEPTSYPALAPTRYGMRFLSQPGCNIGCAT